MDIKYIDLSERSREILKTIIRTYIDCAEPVGSRTVAKKADLGLSPATIRNDMADLEDIGLLFQPHTSAGRLPTEMGLRYYVNFLLEKENLSWGDQVAIEQGLMFRSSDLVAVLRKAVQLLAFFSGHAAIASAPRPISEHLKHLEFLRIRSGLILLITISDTGLVQNRLVQIDHDISEEKLEHLSRYINSRLVHVSLDKLRSMIIKELEKEKKAFDFLLKDLLDRKRDSVEEEIFIDGRLNLLDEMKFSDISRIRALLKTFEEKEALLALLDRCLDSKEVQIFIGSEGLGDEVPACGMVFAPYAGNDSPLGSLGVVGPLRMNYARMVALVEYTAQILTERFKES